MAEPGQEAFERAMPYLQQAAENNSLFVNFSDFGLRTFHDYQEFEYYLLDHRTEHESLPLRQAATLMFCEPLPYRSEANLPSENAGALDTRPSLGDVVTGTQSVGTDHFTPLYYQVNEKMSNENVLGTFVSDFAARYPAVSDLKKRGVLQRLSYSSCEKPEPILCPQHTFANFCLDNLANMFDSVVDPNVVGHGENSDSVVSVQAGGSEIHGGVGANFAGRVFADILLAIAVDGDMGDLSPLVLAEVKDVPIDRVIFCLKWHFYLVVGGPRPEYPEQPSAHEMTAAVHVVDQVLLCCFQSHIPRAILSDCRSATLIEFDLRTAHKERSKTIEEMREKLNLEKEGEIPEELKYKGKCTLGYCGLRYRTTYFDSADLPMKLMIAATAFKQLKVIENGRVEQQKSEFNAFANKLQMSASDTATRTKERRQETGHRKDAQRGGAEPRPGQGATRRDRDEELGPPLAGSSASFSDSLHSLYDTNPKSRVIKQRKQFNFDPIQFDSEYLNQVVRLNDCSHFFPKASGDSVILKVLDFGRLEEYYHYHRSDLDGMTSTEFDEICTQSYEDEVECYLRIEQYNRTAADKIYAPMLLDHGFCNLQDDSGAELFYGSYLVLEDLGEGQSVESIGPNLKPMLDHQYELMLKIGIDYCDRASRNYIIKDGHVYVLDYNKVRLSGWPL